MGAPFSLADFLLSKKIINEEQLRRVKEETGSSGESMRQVLVRLGFAKEKDLLHIISGQTGIPYLDLSTYVIDPAVVRDFPEELARKHLVLPLFKIGDTMTLAALEPLDIYALDELKMKTGSQIELVLVDEDKLRKVLDEHYKIKGSIEEIAKQIGQEKREEILPGEQVLNLERLVEISQEAPIVKIVNLMLSTAIENAASDIHVEPEEKGVRIRTRIDGVLQEVNLLEKRLQPQIITRIKILARMDIAESRHPQDGRFQLKFGNREVDVRASSYPTVYGENLVLRLLDKSTGLLSLDQLGLVDDLPKFMELIKRPYGIILVTGPTGSGKTTTLYAAMNTINDLTKNIITIEDPVEYQISNVRQSQVNPKIGLTFANGLRAILRQDPDIIMVGEIRDFETAEIAIHSALTGHLVFSTLHTNDAPGALTRLVDMGVEPFLITSSVAGVIAQRLVRKICNQCKQPISVEPSVIKSLHLLEEKAKQVTLYEGKGCKHCRFTGYSGRTGIFELMTVNEEINSLVMQKATVGRVKEAAVKAGFKSIKTDGIKKALAGITTLKEVLRVTQLEEE